MQGSPACHGQFLGVLSRAQASTATACSQNHRINNKGTGQWFVCGSPHARICEASLRRGSRPPHPIPLTVLFLVLRLEDERSSSAKAGGPWHPPSTGRATASGGRGAALLRPAAMFEGRGHLGPAESFIFVPRIGR